MLRDADRPWSPAGLPDGDGGDTVRFRLGVRRLLGPDDGGVSCPGWLVGRFEPNSMEGLMGRPFGGVESASTVISAMLTVVFRLDMACRSGEPCWKERSGDVECTR